MVVLVEESRVNKCSKQGVPRLFVTMVTLWKLWSLSATEHRSESPVTRAEDVSDIVTTYGGLPKFQEDGSNDVWHFEGFWEVLDSIFEGWNIEPVRVTDCLVGQGGLSLGTFSWSCWTRTVARPIPHALCPGGHYHIHCVQHTVWQVRLQYLNEFEKIINHNARSGSWYGNPEWEHSIWYES